MTTGGLFILVRPGSGGSGDSDSLTAAMADDVFAAVSLGGGGGREEARESFLTGNTTTVLVLLADAGGGSGRAFVWREVAQGLEGVRDEVFIIYAAQWPLFPQTLETQIRTRRLFSGRSKSWHRARSITQRYACRGADIGRDSSRRDRDRVVT